MDVKMSVTSIVATLFCTLLSTSVPISAQKTSDKKLIVTTILNDPFLKLVDSNETLQGNERFEGYIADLIQELAQRLNLDYELRLVPDNNYGSLEPNGTWTGMMKELLDKKADIAAAPFTMTAIRATYIDFSVPFMNAGPVIVMRRPSNRYSSSILTRFLRLLTPFGDMVWLTILVAYIVTGFFLYIVSYCNPYEWRHMARDGMASIREGEAFTCMNTYWFLLSTIMWQGFVRAPRSLGGRIITGFWWVFVVFTLITYTGALTNYLRVFKESDMFHPVVHNFDELAASKLRVGAIESGSTKMFFQRSKLPRFQKIFEKLNSSHNTAESIKDGIEKVRSDRYYVFIMESVSAQYVTSQFCDLMYTEDTAAEFMLSLGLPKGSPYLDIIDLAMLDLRESGKLEVLKERWLEPGLCDYTAAIPRHPLRSFTPDYFIQVDIATFSGVLILLAIGIVLGCLVTAVEVCLFKVAEKVVEDEELIENQPAQVKKESDV